MKYEGPRGRYSTVLRGGQEEKKDGQGHWSQAISGKPATRLSGAGDGHPYLPGIHERERLASWSRGQLSRMPSGQWMGSRSPPSTVRGHQLWSDGRGEMRSRWKSGEDVQEDEKRRGRRATLDEGLEGDVEKADDAKGRRRVWTSGCRDRKNNHLAHKDVGFPRSTGISDSISKVQPADGRQNSTSCTNPSRWARSVENKLCKLLHNPRASVALHSSYLQCICRSRKGSRIDVKTDRLSPSPSSQTEYLTLREVSLGKPTDGARWIWTSSPLRLP
ncbi:hypothetical protein VTN02DRAFT_1221 [Thermoascus thermophilus]